MLDLQNTLQRIKEVQKILAKTPHSLKVKILQEMAQAIRVYSQEILQANAIDRENAKDSLSQAMLKRLTLDESKILAMAASIDTIALLPNPLDRVLDGWKNDRELEIQKISVPIGVIAIIYESRPNVTSDSAALCFKSGNACILKGGKEAKNSNKVILKLLQNVLIANNFPKECIFAFEDYNYEIVLELIRQNQYIDLLIPRGGEGLISFVSSNATIPVLKHDKGVCHLYIHSDAEIETAIAIAIDAKTQYPSACNAIETLLIHTSIAAKLLPPLYQAFFSHGTILKVDKKTQEILQTPLISLQTDDLNKEYGDNILNILIVNNLDEAIKHINHFGSGHSEAIVTQGEKNAKKFLEEVDSSCVYVNASTRFSDGGEFGFGAEIGISTNKLHARGPVGLEGLTTYKYKIYGEGQVKCPQTSTKQS